MSFYGVRFNDSSPSKGSVVSEWSEVKQLMKEHKEARFKVFNTQEEAVDFVQATDEAVTVPHLKGELMDKKTTLSTPKSGEGCAFPSLTPQELKSLKLLISSCSFVEVCARISSNPRYLVTPYDTPSVLNTGTRMNALHVAANTCSIQMVQLIMSKIECTEFLQSLHPELESSLLARKREHLIDLYLNLPTRGRNETPLHLATRKKSAEIVAFLVSFSSCDTQCRNFDNKTALDIIEESKNQDYDLYKVMKRSLERHVYIPLIRVQDSNTLSVANIQWSKEQIQLSTTPITSDNDDEDWGGLLKEPLVSSPRIFRKNGVDGIQQESSFREPHPPSPVVLPPFLRSTHCGANDDGESTVKLIGDDIKCLDGVLGPLTPEEATKAVMTWRKRTPKSGKKRGEAVEAFGYELARDLESNFYQYWSFLNDYCDLSNECGLSALEQHLSQVKQRLIQERNQPEQFHGDEDDENNRCATSMKSVSSIGERRDLASSPVSSLITQLESLSLNSPPTFVLQEMNKKDQYLEDVYEDALDELGSKGEEKDGDNDSLLSFVTVDEEPEVFVTGSKPNQLDLKVFKVLKDVSVERFPLVAEHKALVQSFSEDERQSWIGANKKRDSVIKGQRLNFEE